MWSFLPNPECFTTLHFKVVVTRATNDLVTGESTMIVSLKVHPPNFFCSHHMGVMYSKKPSICSH